MPSCRVVNSYNVADIQKGLKVLARERSWSVDPGAIDGAWGPRTRTALRNMMIGVNCPAEDIQFVTDAWQLQMVGDRETLAPVELTTALILPAARRWRQQATADAPDTSPPAPPEVTLPPRRPRPPEAGPLPSNGSPIAQSGFSRWGWWAGGISAAIAVVAFIWWWQKKRKRR